MAFTTATKNDAVDAITARGDWIVPCTGDPGTTGANLATGVSPQQTVWPAASGGVATGTQCTYASAPAEHFTHYAVFDDASKTTFVFGDALDPDITFGAPGTLYITPRVTFP